MDKLNSFCWEDYELILDGKIARIIKWIDDGSYFEVATILKKDEDILTFEINKKFVEDLEKDVPLLKLLRFACSSQSWENGK